MPGTRLDRARVLALGGAGVLMLMSVTLIALQRSGLSVPAGWVAVPAILAQLAALAGLASLFVVIRRTRVLLAVTGFAATLFSVALIMVAAVWLILAATEAPPPGIQILAAAFIVSLMVAFLANSAALLRSGRAARSLGLCLLVPPLLSGGMMIVALVRGMEAALRLDLYTNAGAGVALLCAAAILRRSLPIGVERPE